MRAAAWLGAVHEDSGVCSRCAGSTPLALHVSEYSEEKPQSYSVLLLALK